MLQIESSAREVEKVVRWPEERIQQLRGVKKPVPYAGGRTHL